MVMAGVCVDSGEIGGRTLQRGGRRTPLRRRPTEEAGGIFLIVRTGSDRADIWWYKAVYERCVSVRTWPAVPGSVERGWMGRSMSDHWLACGDRLWIVGLVGGPGATKGS